MYLPTYYATWRREKNQSETREEESDAQGRRRRDTTYREHRIVRLGRLGILALGGVDGLVMPYNKVSVFGEALKQRTQER